MKKAVLFDMDNTLIDREKAMRIAYRDQVKLFYPDDEAKQEEMYGYLLEIDDHGQMPPLRRYQYARDRMGFSQELVYEGADWWNANQPYYTIVYPQAKKTLRALQKKYRLGMVTDGQIWTQRKKLETAGLEEFFEEVLVSSEVGKDKPHPRIFEVILEKMNLRPEECYYVGDISWKDIAGAYRAGITPVHITAHGEIPCPGFLHIQAIEELPEVLQKYETSLENPETSGEEK